MTEEQKLIAIHESLINGQRRQMVDQINAHFIMYDFWKKYLEFLDDCGYNKENILDYFSDAVISYHRLTGR